MARIFMRLDKDLLFDEQLKTRLIGGSENFFFMVANWLRGVGHEVDIWPPKPTGEYDLCIHSNVMRLECNAKKHVLWAASWHASGYENADLTILASEFMKETKGWDDAVVIPIAVRDEVFHLMSKRKDRKIVCHSNPSRHFNHTSNIANLLAQMGEKFEWEVCGGNKLYSPRFQEMHNFNANPRVLSHGPIPLEDAWHLVQTADVWVYPNLTDNSETQCVAMLEAAAIGVPVFLPRRRPFTDLLPGAVFCETEEEFATMIGAFLTGHGHYRAAPKPVEFAEGNVMPRFIECLEEVL